VEFKRYRQVATEVPLRTAVGNPVGAGKPNVANAVVVPAVSNQELQKLAQMMQQRVAARSPDLQFSVDQDSGKSVIKVTDRTTHELIWQVPSEVALKVTKEIDLFLKGSFLNHKV
jgi:flagellar protein FlaG